MKIIALLFLLFLFKPVFGQTYSSVIPDKEIIDFINADIKRDSIKNRKAIRRDIIIPDKNNFYYKDSAELLAKSDYSLQNHDFIFKHVPYLNKIISNDLDTLFTRPDIDFFLQQIEGITTRRYWKKSFYNSTLVDGLEYIDDDYHYVKEVVFTYSIPIFSLDRKKGIIIKHFSCGFFCGGTSYYLYQFNEKNEWRLRKEFNIWAE